MKRIRIAKSCKNRTRAATFIADGAIFTVLAAAIALAVFAARYVLYGSAGGYEVTENIITESIPSGTRVLICEGDVIYDTVTKRAIGKVLSVAEDGERLRISLTLKAKPRTDALRTRLVWFKYQRQKGEAMEEDAGERKAAREGTEASEAMGAKAKPSEGIGAETEIKTNGWHREKAVVSGTSVSNGGERKETPCTGIGGAYENNKPL